MPTSYTTLLGLALPVQGELQGTWGDEVNNYITNYLDASVAGTQTLSTDADVTLTKTTGTALGATSSQYLILNCTGSRAAARNITVPAQSKAYVVINGTTGGFAVTLRGAGPTTGVSIAAGERAVCVWNGSDFVKAASSNGSPGGSTTQVQYNNAGALAGSANLTFDGTSLTLGGNPTLSAGTANGVAYLNGSKVLTSGSALTFDGTTFGLTVNALFNNSRVLQWKNASGVTRPVLQIFSDNNLYIDSEDGAQIFRTLGSEQMRLTSTGLGIGTSSPGARLQVSATSPTNGITSIFTGSGSTGAQLQLTQGGIDDWAFGQPAGVSAFAIWSGRAVGSAGTERMRLDSSGNLGIGTSSPSYKVDISAPNDSTARVRLATTTGYNIFWSQNTSGGTWVGTEGSAGGALMSGTPAWASVITSTVAAPICFGTNTTERMRLDSSGNLGIGTSSPGYKLDVNGAVRAQGDGSSVAYYVPASNAIRQIGSGSALYIDLSSTGSAGSFVIRNSNAFTTQLTLDASGNLGLGVTPSAWAAGAKALQMDSYSSFFESVAGRTVSSFNAYESSTNSYKYLQTEAASMYQQVSGVHYWFTAPSGTAGNAITFTQAMTLDASGNLGIGLTTPAGRVTIKGASGASALQQLGFQYHGSSSYFMALGVQDVSGNAQVMAGSGASLVFYTNSDLASTNERARITSGGDLWVGATAAISPGGLTANNVLSAGTSSQWAAAVRNSTATTPWGLAIQYSAAAPNDASSTFLYCIDSGPTLRASIRSNGGIANYQANDVNLSDRREKTNFAPAKDYLDTICAIPVQTFNYIDQSEDDPGLTLGVVAQDVQAVAPELVHESNWGTEDEPKMRLSVYQTDLQYALMKCIQEQQALITDLRARVAQLERQA